MLADKFGELLRFDHRRRRWLVWSEHRWGPDVDGVITRCARQMAQIRYYEAAGVSDYEEKQRQAKWAMESESRFRINAAVDLAKDTKPIADAGENWDSDTWLLGVKNGVVNLKTGELRTGRAEDRITMTTAVDYDTDAECPRFLQFLDEVFGDADLIDWLWRALGYSISGDASEQVVFMGYGRGANGKSKLRDAIHAAIGDYAFSSPFSTFELHQRSSIPNDLAALEFKRFVDSSETNDKTRLNEARIKAISGGDPITARFLHQEYFTFWPHLKLWLFVNHKPTVQDDSHGFWRRVRLIPFIRQFEGAADDKNLGGKLRAEAQGILNWLVRGCLEWQQRGLAPIPQSVRIATEEYKKESDVLIAFIEDRCIEHRNATVRASELYSEYKQWAESEGLREKDKEYMTSTKFGRTMGDRYRKNRKGGVVYYHGIGLAGQFQDSFVANDTKICVSPYGLPVKEEDKGTILDYPDYPDRPMLGLTFEQVLEIWRAEGSPAIQLSQCETSDDLELLLSSKTVSDAHIQAITEWLSTALESRKAEA